MSLTEQSEMTSLLKRLSTIDDKTKYGVYGWIREAEKELKSSQIPLMISSICILYYHEYDTFEIVPDNTRISCNGKCITKINQCRNDVHWGK